MKMIAKVFLVIAVLLICLIVWALFLGGDGILMNAWNGVAEQVNQTWQAVTGLSTDVIPEWNADGTQNVNDGIGNIDVGTGGSGGGGATGP